MFKFKLIDTLIVLSILSLGGIILYSLYSNTLEEKFVELWLDDEMIEHIELNRGIHKLITIDENGVYAQIEINDDRARFLESNCRDKICVRTGHISRTNQISVCVPNKISLKISGNASGEIDAIS